MLPQLHHATLLSPSKHSSNKKDQQTGKHTAPAANEQIPEEILQPQREKYSQRLCLLTLPAAHQLALVQKVRGVRLFLCVCGGAQQRPQSSLEGEKTLMKVYFVMTVV
jgi:hypothetical protein